MQLVFLDPTEGHYLDSVSFSVDRIVFNKDVMVVNMESPRHYEVLLDMFPGSVFLNDEGEPEFATILHENGYFKASNGITYREFDLK